MRKHALCLTFITFLFTLVESRGGQLFPKIKKDQPRPPPGENINVPIDNSAQSESTVKKLIPYAYLLLTFPLIFKHSYYTERKYKYIKIKEEDLGFINREKVAFYITLNLWSYVVRKIPNNWVLSVN
ncbi:hypothetical protein ACFL7M_05175 [Thermodesulfobacteriota bacterium]